MKIPRRRKAAGDCATASARNPGTSLTNQTRSRKRSDPTAQWGRSRPASPPAEIVAGKELEFVEELSYGEAELLTQPDAFGHGSAGGRSYRAHP